MNTSLRFLRSYYRTNVAAFEAIRRAVSRHPVGAGSLAVGVYLATSLALNATGHTAAAWVCTAVVGLPLLFAAWTV